MPKGSYTVGDIAAAMKRCAVRHIIVDRDREALASFAESTWIQLAVAAMLVTVHVHEVFDELAEDRQGRMYEPG